MWKNRKYDPNLSFPSSQRDPSIPLSGTKQIQAEAQHFHSTYPFDYVPNELLTQLLRESQSIERDQTSQFNVIHGNTLAFCEWFELDTPFLLFHPSGPALNKLNILFNVNGFHLHFLSFDLSLFFSFTLLIHAIPLSQWNTLTSKSEIRKGSHSKILSKDLKMPIHEITLSTTECMEMSSLLISTFDFHSHTFSNDYTICYSSRLTNLFQQNIAQFKIRNYQ